MSLAIPNRYITDKFGGLGRYKKRRIVNLPSSSSVTLVIGSVHNNPEVQTNDREKEKDLIAWGYNVTRFSNKQVMEEIESVMEEIHKVLVSKMDKRPI